MTQNNKILEYMRANGGITSFEAFAKLRITRLSGRIHELRQMGHKIGMAWEETEDKTRFGRYFIERQG